MLSPYVPIVVSVVVRNLTNLLPQAQLLVGAGASRAEVEELSLKMESEEEEEEEVQSGRKALLAAFDKLLA
jgi:hypothetical protein